MTGPYGAPRGPYELEIQQRLTPRQRVRLSVIGALVMLAGVLVALTLTLFTTTIYLGETQIYYHLRVENATYFMRTDANLSDQQLLLTDNSVLGPVAAAHGMTVPDLAAKVSAQIVDNSDLIKVDVRDPDRNTGVALAGAIGKQYLSVVAGLSQGVAIQQQLDQARASLSSANGAQAAAITARIAMLGEQLDIVNTARNTAQIVVPAYSVADPASPDRALAAKVGAVVGAVLAALVCTLLFRRWTEANLRRNATMAAPMPQGALPW